LLSNGNYRMKHRKRVSVTDLRVGMRLMGLDRPWMQTPFLWHRMMLRTEAQIAKIIECGAKYAEIETEELANEPASHRIEAFEKAPETTVPAPETPRLEQVPFAEEMAPANEVYNAAKTILHDAMEDIRMGREVNVAAVAGVVENILESLIRNPDTLPSLTQLKTHDEYTFCHSVNVGILSVAFGRHHGLSPDALRRLGIGGLLHDIGKVRVPLNILNKPGRYTRDEYDVVKRHPEVGAEILSRTPGIEADSIHPALEHHERGDGTGYPYNKTLAKMNFFGLITQIADVYDAMTSERVYHQERPPYEVLRYLYARGQSGHFDLTTVQKFIQCVGIYPVGSLVELNTGESGIVTSLNRDWLLAPRVLITQGRNGPLAAPYLEVDLAESNLDPTRTIMSVLDHSSFSINLADYLANPQPRQSE
jgi:HD-GYP domain-containing protein (c-di-GMP phosphodiesterase class II)